MKEICIKEIMHIHDIKIKQFSKIQDKNNEDLPQ